jgi:hypothetical protein
MSPRPPRPVDVPELLTELGKGPKKAVALLVAGRSWNRTAQQEAASGT